MESSEDEERRERRERRGSFDATRRRDLLWRMGNLKQSTNQDNNSEWKSESKNQAKCQWVTHFEQRSPISCCLPISDTHLRNLQTIINICMLIIFGVTRFHFISTHTDWDHTELAKLNVIGLSMVTGAWLILTKHY